MTRLADARVRGSVAGAWWLAWRARRRAELATDESVTFAVALELIGRLRRRLTPHRCPDCHMWHGGIGQ